MISALYISLTENYSAVGIAPIVYIATGAALFVVIVFVAHTIDRPATEGKDCSYVFVAVEDVDVTKTNWLVFVINDSEDDLQHILLITY